VWARKIKNLGSILFQFARVWILRRNLRSFPPCFSQVTSTSTALPWDFYVFKLTQPLTVSTVRLVNTLMEKGGKPDRKPIPLPNGLRNPYRNLKSEKWELSR
jgi:hypothetical protein